MENNTAENRNPVDISPFHNDIDTVTQAEQRSEHPPQLVETHRHPNTGSASSTMAASGSSAQGRGFTTGPVHPHSGDASTNKAFKLKNLAVLTPKTSRFFFSFHTAIWFFSLLVLIDTAFQLDRGLNSTIVTSYKFIQYELAVAQVSFAISSMAIMMERWGEFESRTARLVVSGTQVFIWFPTLTISTIYGSLRTPVETPNGFFGVWGATTASVVVFVYEAERFRDEPQLSPVPKISLALLLVYSIMIMLGGVFNFTRFNDSPDGFTSPDYPYSYVAFYVALGSSVAFFTLLFLLFMDFMPSGTRIILGTFMWLYVGIGVAILTFRYPNRFAVSNGYYAGLFSILASNGLLMSLRRARFHSGLLKLDSGEHRGLINANLFFAFLRGTTFSSMVVMITAILVCTDKNGCANNFERYQIAAGGTPFIIGIGFILLELFRIYHIGPIFRLVLAILFFAWWIAAFTSLTFFGSFQTPAFPSGFYANGFIFCWLSLLFACLCFSQAVKGCATGSRSPHPYIGRLGFLCLIILGSTIELGSAIRSYFDYPESFAAYSRYAISLGTVSIGMALILMVAMGATHASDKDLTNSFFVAGLYFLTLWWALGTLVLTFSGFWGSATHNGYFSLFFTLGACLLGLSGIWSTTITSTEEC